MFPADPCMVISTVVKCPRSTSPGAFLVLRGHNSRGPLGSVALFYAQFDPSIDFRLRPGVSVLAELDGSRKASSLYEAGADVLMGPNGLISVSRSRRERPSRWGWRAKAGYGSDTNLLSVNFTICD